MDTDNPKLVQIKERYRLSLTDKAQSFKSKLDLLSKPEQDIEQTVYELKDMLHKLAGSAGMYGYSQISQDARSALDSCNQDDVDDLKVRLKRLQSLLRNSA